MAISNHQEEQAKIVAEAKLRFDTPSGDPANLSLSRAVELGDDAATFLVGEAKGGAAQTITHMRLKDAASNYLVAKYGSNRLVEEIAKHRLEKEFGK